MRRLAPPLALVLLLGVSACTSKPPKPTEFTKVTLAVFLDSDVTADRKTAVEQRLRSMPSVEEVSFESRDQVYAREKEALKDSPDLLAEIKPEHMPELFHATVTDAPIAEAVELVMTDVDGVDEVVLKVADVDPLPSRIGIVVRLKPSATGEQRTAVEQAVRALPTARSVEFEDRAAAYERLRTRCQGKGDLTTQLQPQMGRESWRFEMPLDKKGPGVSELRKLDGVDAVQLVPLMML
ncbi:permease-like cell division protein FtsX [Micromonospora sp. NPDC005174]|uniref:permease-like cell division protein FtsX n=1 Tax=unclassified Micromonospora TaxID=2617518 RepID=UPI0033B4B379